MPASGSPLADPQLTNIVRDFLFGLHRCFKTGLRMKGVVEHSLSLRAVDDLTQSALAVHRLARDGMQRPLQRELLHMLETSIRHLYADQRQRGQSFAQRARFLEQELGGDALSYLHGLELTAFRDAVRRSFVAQVHATHRALTPRESPPWEESGRRLARLAVGEDPGFHHGLDAAELNRQVFAVSEIVLVLTLHALGLRLAGQVFVSYVDLQPAWAFHRSDYLDRFSEYYDYRPERRAAL